jgi:hypothetical protein
MNEAHADVRGMVSRASEAIAGVIEAAQQAKWEGERMATLELAAEARTRIADGMEPHEAIQQALNSVWGERGLDTKERGWNPS